MTTESGLISIIVPTHNRASLLQDALDSIYKQTYQNFEILLVDDGSTDLTADVSHGYDHRLRYFYQQKAGVSAARNHALKQAKGKFVAFLDDDDLYHPKKLEVQKAFLEANKDVVWAYTGFQLIDLQGESLPNGTISPQSLKINPHEIALFTFMIPSAMMVHTEALRKIGGFPDGIGISEDYHVWSKLLSISDGAAIPDILTNFRIHAGNTPLPFHEHFKQNREIIDYLLKSYPNRLQKRSHYIKNLEKIISDNLRHKNKPGALFLFRLWRAIS